MTAPVSTRALLFRCDQCGTDGRYDRDQDAVQLSISTTDLCPDCVRIKLNQLMDSLLEAAQEMELLDGKPASEHLTDALIHQIAADAAAGSGA